MLYIILPQSKGGGATNHIMFAVLFHSFVYKSLLTFTEYVKTTPLKHKINTRNLADRLHDII